MVTEMFLVQTVDLLMELLFIFIVMHIINSVELKRLRAPRENGVGKNPFVSPKVCIICFIERDINNSAICNLYYIG